MRIELTPVEAELLLRLLHTSDPERLREIHRAEASGFRERLERDARAIQEIEQKLEAVLSTRAEDGLDETVEESFPASDPPAHFRHPAA